MPRLVSAFASSLARRHGRGPLDAASGWTRGAAPPAGVSYAPSAGGVRSEERVGTLYPPTAPSNGIAWLGIHGGGFRQVNPSTAFSNVCAYFASKGYTGFDVRYRLVTGNDAVTGRDSVEDVALAVLYLLTLPGITQVVIGGHSTGSRIAQTLAAVRAYLDAVGVDLGDDIAALVSLDGPYTFDEVPKPGGGVHSAAPPRTTAGFTVSAMQISGDVRSSTPNDVNAPTQQNGGTYDRDRFTYGGVNADGSKNVSPTGLATVTHFVGEPECPPIIGTFTREANELRGDSAAQLSAAMVGHPRATVQLYEAPSTTPHLDMVQLIGNESDAVGGPMTAWLLARVDEACGITR